MSAPGNIVVPPGTATTISCVLGSTAFTLSGGGVLVLLNNGGNFSEGETVVGCQHHPGRRHRSRFGKRQYVPLILLQNGGIYQDNDSTA